MVVLAYVPSPASSECLSTTERLVGDWDVIHTLLYGSLPGDRLRLWWRRYEYRISGSMDGRMGATVEGADSEPPPATLMNWRISECFTPILGGQ